MRKQDAGFDFHRYRQLLAEADDETKRLALIDLLIKERAKERLEAQRTSDRDAVTATTIAKVLGTSRTWSVTDRQAFTRAFARAWKTARQRFDRRRIKKTSDVPADSLVRMQSLRHRSESHANPVFLDPGNPAFVDRGAVRHHQAKARGTKAGFSTSMAAPSAEIFRTMQLMTEPPDDT
jgi:acyl-CoA hydrolase